jgi:hypothetical protein
MAPSVTIPHWPRMLSRPMAAAYLGTTLSGFDRLALPSVLIGGRRVWDRQALDGYADSVGAVGTPIHARDHWLQVVRDADATETR